ncbi:collagen binding domain-containing protein [Cytobacillus pseudoceanisediminis]|uniref:Collagen binding domain-containing protein n=1 Tax=Cytobacillus pseudoceanisediminis TaxID=3051614 RepID=A0ABZ2ZFD9_9BACI
MKRKFSIIFMTIMLLINGLVSSTLGYVQAEEQVQPAEGEINGTENEAGIDEATIDPAETIPVPEQRETSAADEKKTESPPEAEKESGISEENASPEESVNKDIQTEESPQPEQLESDAETGLNSEDASGEESKYVSGEETDVEKQVITENILTDVVLKDGAGKNIEDIRVDQGSKVRIEYQWSIPAGHDYSGGAVFTFTLPDKFKTDRLLTGNLDGGAGTYEVSSNGAVTFIFNETIDDGTGLTGNFYVEREFDMGKFSGSTKQEVQFPIKGTEKVILVHFKNNKSEMDKTGAANKVINPSEIKWVVDFNLGENKMNSTLFKDTLPDGLEIDMDSIEVYQLNVNLDGSVIAGNLLNNYTPIKTADGFEIPFNEIDSAYRVKYSTKITGTADKTFTNEATVSSTDLSDIKQTANVPVKFSQPLGKSSIAYDSSNQTITWAIQYNYNEQEILSEDAWIKDTFDTVHQVLVDSSFEVYTMTIKEDGSASKSGTPLEKGIDYTVVPDVSGFKLQFKNDVATAYEITYQTKAINRVHEDSYSVTNKAEIYDGTSESATRNIKQVIFQKNSANVDYNQKTIEWNILLNDDNKKMDQVTITDSFEGQNLKLIEDSLIIEGLEPEDYTLVPNFNYGEGFKIFFNNSITGSHLIKYKTIFDPRKPIPNGGYKNSATLNWFEEGVQQSPITKSAKIAPDSYTNKNGNKTGVYNARTKEITWTIDVNYNLHEIKDALIRDFYSGEQTLVEDSLKVYHLRLNGGPDGVSLGEEKTDFSMEVKEDPEGKDGFEIKLGTINTAYRITYKTSLKGLPVDASYSNNAILQDGDGGTPIFKQSVSVLPKHGGEYIQKNGTQGTGADLEFSLWSVHINRSQSYLKAASVLSDTLSENQILIQDSINLYKTAVSENGTLTKANLEDPSKYTLAVSGNTIQLTFNDEVEESYVLEYKAFINADHGEEVSNKVQFAGKSTGDVQRSDNEKFAVSFSEAGGGAFPSGKGNFKVVKTDADTNMPLAGAIFGLYDKSGTALLEKLETDEKGEAEFKAYKYKSYKLKELTPPVGFVISDEYKTGKEITFTETDQTFTVANKKLLQAVELTKLDQADASKNLEGAEFELYKKSNAGFFKVSSHTTDENGQIIINELPPGDYQFVETKAPLHYLLDTSPIGFTIEEEQTAAVKVKKANERGKGSLTIKKVDAADEKTRLKGAEFELYDEKGQFIDRTATDAEGLAVFKDLPFDSYLIKETKAPSGYAIDPASVNIPITIDAPTKELTVKNHKIIHAVKLTKAELGNPSKTLKEARFILMYKKDKNSEYALADVKGEYTTDETGVIYKEDLEPGFYQFIETKAPPGYLLDTTPVEFTIEEEQIHTVSLTKLNRRIPAGGGETPDPEGPGNPGGEEPDPEDPGNPGGEEPDPEDPGNPGGEEPDPEDPGNPGEEEPDPEDPGNPGGEKPDPEDPGNPGGEKPDPENPNEERPDSEEPHTPGISKELNQNGHHGDNGLTKPGTTLPKTGEKANIGMLAGAGFIIFGVWILLYRRKTAA